jgi:hypothetical protein
LGHLNVLGYENVYFSRRGDNTGGEAVNMRHGLFDDELVAGFTTSPKTRPLMLAKMEEFIRNKTITIYSKRFLEEIRTFVWNNGRAEAQRGHSDDLTLAAAIGIWMRDTYLTPAFADSRVSEKMMAGIGMTRTQNNQIPGASKDPYRSPKSVWMGVSGAPNSERVGMSTRIQNGKSIDFSWLIK